VLVAYKLMWRCQGCRNELARRRQSEATLSLQRPHLISRWPTIQGHRLLHMVYQHGVKPRRLTRVGARSLVR